MVNAFLQKLQKHSSPIPYEVNESGFGFKAIYLFSIKMTTIKNKKPSFREVKKIYKTTGNFACRLLNQYNEFSLTDSV
jgi:hypothetical protein